MTLDEKVDAKVMTYFSVGEHFFVFGDPEGFVAAQYPAVAAYDPTRNILVGVEYTADAQAHLPYFVTGEKARETYERIAARASVSDRLAPKEIFDIAELVSTVEPALPDFMAEIKQAIVSAENNTKGVATVCTYDASYENKKFIPCILYVRGEKLLLSVYCSGEGFAFVTKRGEGVVGASQELASKYKDPKEKTVYVSENLIQFALQHYAITEKLPLLQTFIQEVI